MIVDAAPDDIDVLDDCDDVGELTVGVTSSDPADLRVWEGRLRDAGWRPATLHPSDAAGDESSWVSPDRGLAVVLLQDDPSIAGTRVDLEMFVPHPIDGRRE